MLSGSGTSLEVAYDQVHCHAGQAVRSHKRLYNKWAVKCVLAIGDWTMRYYPPSKKCKLDLPWLGPYLVVSLAGWPVGVQLHPYSPVLPIHCQDIKKIALRIGRSRRAEHRVLNNVDISWDQQMANMFQILNALVFDVPEASACLDQSHYRRMRSSNDSSLDKTVTLTSPGVVDLDPGALVLPGLFGNLVCVLVPDAVLTSMEFHDIIVDDLVGTPDSRAKLIVPCQATYLRRRWPPAVL